MKFLESMEGMRQSREIFCHFCRKPVPVRPLFSREDGKEIVRCKECGICFLFPIPTREEIERWYTDPAYFSSKSKIGYQDYLLEQAQDDSTGNGAWARRLSWIEATRKKGKLLDVGSAMGHFLHAARKRGWEVEGVDLSPSACQYARESFGIRTHHGTLLSGNFMADSFDLVTLWETLEHLPDPLSSLREVSRVLKPGGEVWLSTPNFQAFALEGKKWIVLYRAWEHLYYFTPDFLVRLLRLAGFRKIRWLTSTPPDAPRRRLWRYLLGSRLLDRLGYGHDLFMKGEKG